MQDGQGDPRPRRRALRVGTSRASSAWWIARRRFAHFQWMVVHFCAGVVVGYRVGTAMRSRGRQAEGALLAETRRVHQMCCLLMGVISMDYKRIIKVI